jgi:hypothetical protein
VFEDSDVILSDHKWPPQGSKPYFVPYWTNLLLLALGIAIETAYNTIFPLCLKYLRARTTRYCSTTGCIGSYGRTKGILQAAA